MVRAPLKRSFGVTTSSNDGENENENRTRRQRTVSTTSCEPTQPSSLRRSQPLTEKGNTQEGPTISSTFAPTTRSTGRATTQKLAFDALKGPSSHRTATLQQKAPVPNSQRSTRIPIKTANSIPRAAGGSVIRKLEPCPPPVATPLLSLHSPPSVSLSLGTVGIPAPPHIARDVEAEVALSDIETLPSIPSPPASPPPPSLKGRNNQLTEEAIKPKDHSRTPSPPTHSTQIGMALPLKKPSLSERAAPLRGPRKPSVKEHMRTLSKGTKDLANDGTDMVYLDASDCQLFVSFADSPHYEAWDLPDDAIIPCPVQIYIMAKDPSRWHDVPLHLPNVTRLTIECTTKATSSRFSAEQDKWKITFSGASVPTSNGKIPPLQIPNNSIAIENRWERVLNTPTIGKCCRDNYAAHHGTPPPAPPLNLSSPPDESSPAPAHPFVPGRGFVMRVWVPIPTHLFLKKETRVFEVSSKVWMQPPGEGNPDTGADSAYLANVTEMTVSHLRTEREMMPL